MASSPVLIMRIDMRALTPTQREDLEAALLAQLEDSGAVLIDADDD